MPLHAVLDLRPQMLMGGQAGTLFRLLMEWTSLDSGQAGRSKKCSCYNGRLCEPHYTSSQLLRVWNHARRDAPDVLCVLGDGAVGRELAHARCGHDAHARPLGLVLVRLIDLGLRDR